MCLRKWYTHKCVDNLLAGEYIVRWTIERALCENVYKKWLVFLGGISSIADKDDEDRRKQLCLHQDNAEV